MRNLKRALCFALAAVMVLGLMITGAGAASTYDNFTDKDEIVHQEAVNTMVSLGVIAGKEDGSYFDPTAIVTRAEMTKVVAVALNGGKDPVFSENDKTTFTDTQGHWAEKYIAYCVRQGIVAGRGNNSFGPDDPLTGSACAKMFLCALGYRADLEGFVNVGNDWELNVNVKANQDAKLYDELSDIVASDELTRDSMAQMLYNAVQADEVIYDNLYGDYSGVVQAVPNGTMLANRFGVAKVEGVVMANDVVAIDGGATTVAGKSRLRDISQDGVSYEDSNGNLLNGIYPVELGNEYLGRRVVLYVKGLKDLSPNASSMTLMGEPILSDDNTVVETASRLKDDSAVRTFLSNNGLSLPDSVTSTVVNGTVSYSENDTTYGATPTRAFAVTQPSNVNGTEFTFIDHDGDSQVDFIFKTLPHMAKVTVYNEDGEKLTIAGEGSINFSDIANPEDVAKDDIVLYYKMNDTWYLNVAETVSGKVTAYNNNNKKITIDGTEYGQSTVTAEVSSTDLTNMTMASDSGGMDFVDNSYTLYLDNNGNVVAWVLDDETLGNYALVLATEGTALGTPAVVRKGSVKLLLADGTTGTYDVNLLASANRFGRTGDSSTKENWMSDKLNSQIAGTTLVNTIVTYVIGENGKVTIGNPDEVSNYDVATSTAGDDVKRATGSYTFSGPTTVKVNDSTLFFIRNVTNSGPYNTDDIYSVVQGVSDMPASRMFKGDHDPSGTPSYATAESAVYTTTSANPNVAKAVFVDGAYKGTAHYVYIADSYTGTSTVNGERVYTYPVVTEDGEATTLKINDPAVEDGMVYEYTLDGDGVADVDLTDRTINGVVSTYSRGSNVTVTKGDDTTWTAAYTIANGAKLWNVEDDPYAETLTDGMSLAIVLDGDGFVKTAFVKDTNLETVPVALASGLTKDASITYNTPVYQGFDVKLVGSNTTIFPLGTRTVSYTVEYPNKADEAKTANVVAGTGSDAGNNVCTFSVPDDAERIVITALPGATSGGSVGGSLDKVAGQNAVTAVDNTAHKITLAHSMADSNAAGVITAVSALKVGALKSALTGAEITKVSTVNATTGISEDAADSAVVTSEMKVYVGETAYTIEFAAPTGLAVSSPVAAASADTVFAYTSDVAATDIAAKPAGSAGDNMKVYAAATGSTEVAGATAVTTTAASVHTLTITFTSAITDDKDVWVSYVSAKSGLESARTKVTCTFVPEVLTSAAASNISAVAGAEHKNKDYDVTINNTGNSLASLASCTFDVYDAATNGNKIGEATLSGSTLSIVLSTALTHSGGTENAYVETVGPNDGVSATRLAVTLTTVA